MFEYYEPNQEVLQVKALERGIERTHYCWAHRLKCVQGDTVIGLVDVPVELDFVLQRVQVLANNEIAEENGLPVFEHTSANTPVTLKVNGEVVDGESSIQDGTIEYSLTFPNAGVYVITIEANIPCETGRVEVLINA